MSVHYTFDVFHLCDSHSLYAEELKEHLYGADSNTMPVLLLHILTNNLTDRVYIDIVTDILFSIYGVSQYDYFVSLMEDNDTNTMVRDLLEGAFDMLDYAYYNNDAELYLQHWDGIFENYKQGTLVRLMMAHTGMINTVRNYLKDKEQ